MSDNGYDLNLADVDFTNFHEEPPIEGGTIIIQDGVQYLAQDEQFAGGLPKNCIFDKGKTGCGGTWIALDPKHGDYVIVVPYVTLIQNKTRNRSDILGIFEGITPQMIQQYHKTHKVRKYMVTWDSLPKLMTAVNVTRFKLLVDEYHTLFTQYGTADSPFRKDPIKYVLKNYNKFAEYCFMSATPLEKDFILDEINHLPMVTAYWPNIETRVIESNLCDNVDATVLKTINHFLDGSIEGNAYFFINSVKTIEFYIENARLNDDNARAIYSQSNTTEVGLIRSDINSEPKKINFLTSTAFEGVDLEDEDGRIFIVSDRSAPYKMIDISTSFMQISGRIRNTRFGNLIVHFFNRTRYQEEVSFEEFKAACLVEAEKQKQDVITLNNTSQEMREKLKLIESERYITKNENHEFLYDSNLLKIDLYQFKLTRILYSSKQMLSQAYLNRGFEVIHTKSHDVLTTEPTEREQLMSFKKKVLRLKELGYGRDRSTKEGNIDYAACMLECLTRDEREDIIQQDPLLSEAIGTLGYEGIERLKYNKKLVERQVTKMRPGRMAKKVADELEKRGFQEQKFYPNGTLKDMLQIVYDYLDFKATASAADITKFYQARPHRPTMPDNSRLEGYWIIKKRSDL